VIETLNDNHSILLLYLTGELPESDRQAVEKRLAADLVFAAQLTELDATHRQLATGIAMLDGLDGSRAATRKAVDSAVEAVSAWRFGARQLRPAMSVRSHRLWSWIGPAALAASVLIAALIWVQRQPASSHPPLVVNAPGVTQPTTKASFEDPSSNNSNDLALLQQSFAAGADEISQHSRSELRREQIAKDDLSDYLLKTEANAQ
jgi:anti-sigma factor RsiW